LENFLDMSGNLFQIKLQQPQQVAAQLHLLSHKFAKQAQSGSHQPHHPVMSHAGQRH
jgi:hypothetical protein